MATFVRQWSQTKSLEEGAENAAYMLEQHPIVDAKLTIDIAALLIDLPGKEIADVQGRHGMLSHHLTPAILNVYHGCNSAAIRRRAIDLFEKLGDLGCSEVPRAMESVDRL